MGGYIGFSRSKRAALAEEFGRYPATRAAQLLGVSTAAVKAVLVPHEWHHASKYFNRVDYYDISLLLDYADGETEGWSTEELDEAAETIRRLKDFKAPKTEENLFRANVHFILWTGTRKHPVANQFHYEGIVVEQHGKRLVFYTPDGKVCKMEGSNGTDVRPQNATPLAVKRQLNKWKREHEHL